MPLAFALVALIGLLVPFSVVSVSFNDLLSTSGGVKVIGESGSQIGANVCMIGDYNKDGKQDFAIAAPLMTVNSNTECGMVLIVLGKDGAWSEIDMATAVSGLSMQRVIGAAAGDKAGTSVGPAGDVNNDGVDDVLIGAPYADPNSLSNSGLFYLLFGKATTAAYADIDLAVFITSASTGFTIAGPNSFYNLGYNPINIRRLGDVNGDNIDDFAVTTQRGSVPSAGAGAAWILYGQNTSFSNINLASLGSAGVLLTGSGDVYLLGSSIDGVGDFNGDGINDVLIGESQYNSATVNYCGAAYLLYGTASWTNMAMASFVTGPKGIRFVGSIHMEFVGRSVSGAGDINGDGKVDLLIGGSGSASGLIGRVHVIFGTSTQFSADIDLGTIFASNLGFTAYNAPNDNRFGWLVSRGGDLDRDGYDDFVISSGFWLYVLYGSNTVPTANINIQTYTGKIAIFEDVATSLSAGVDVTNDGIPDLLLGNSFAGAAYMVKGPIYPPTPSVSPSRSPTLTPPLTPSAAPSVRPTAEPQQVVLDVQQDLYFINKDDYDAQKVQCNKTIQHTVADGIDGVTPERVTDIVVEEEEEEEGGRTAAGNIRRAAVARGVSLKYKVTVYDPLLSAAMLTAQLKEKVRSGDMDVALRTFALRFNATSMMNGTFGVPLITSLNGKTSFNDPPTDSELAGLVIGSVVFAVLLTVGVWLLVTWLRRSSENEGKEVGTKAGEIDTLQPRTSTEGGMAL